MKSVHRIEQMVAPAVNAMGYEIVQIRLIGGARQTLQVMIDREDGQAMTVDDCAEISRTVSAILDVDDPISGAYALEVTSPGIDRPLVRASDFERFAGFEARVEMSRAIDGRKRFRGRLTGVIDDRVRMDVQGDEVELPLADIDKAKLVLTDELIAATVAQEN